MSIDCKEPKSTRCEGYSQPEQICPRKEAALFSKKEQTVRKGQKAAKL
jgi:hypothetical protein